MPAPPYRFRPEIVDELLGHGLRPTSSSSPERLRDYVRDLYLYEIRALRDRLRKREFPKSDYARRVIALRGRYPLLSIPVEHWLEPPGDPTGSPPTA